MIERYFQYDEKTDRMLFTGDELKLYFSKRFERHDLLSYTDTLHAIGFCGMLINGTIKGGLTLAAVITIAPSEVYDETIDDEAYLVAVLKKNDVFLTTCDFIQNDKLGYILWNEFISSGKLPAYITYDNIHDLFVKIAKTTGISFGVNHAIFEMIYAESFRSQKDILTRYRNTDMKEEPIFIGLHDVAAGPNATIDRILGSYDKEGLTAALVNKSEQGSDLEIQLRA